jgi:hypothetical protein
MDEFPVIQATVLLMLIGRRLGCDDDAIRSDVLGALKEALEGDRPCERTMTIDGKPAKMISSAGIFRLMFEQSGIDRSDLRAQEDVYALVERTITEVFALE